MKKLLLTVGSIASVIAPVASVVSCTDTPPITGGVSDQKVLYKTNRQAQETVYVYMWGTRPTETINTPYRETMANFLGRKPQITQRDKVGVEAYLTGYTNTEAVRLKWFVGTEAEFQQHKIDRPIQERADKGLLADDIALLHISINELLSIYIQWLPIQELGTKQRFKLIQQTLIKYNLELVNKDYDPNFVISARDKGVLITALTKIKEIYPDHYALLAKPFKLEADAEPDAIWEAYEAQMDIIHNKAHTPDLTGAGIGQGI